MGSSDRQDQPRRHPPKGRFTMRLEPTGSPDASERLRKALELILTTATDEPTLAERPDATPGPLCSGVPPGEAGLRNEQRVDDQSRAAPLPTDPSAPR